MRKHANKKIATTTPDATTPDATPPPTLTPDLIAQLRAAESIDAGVALLAPESKTKVKLDTTFVVNASCAEPLPQKRGACLKVVAAAVRLDRPFKVADIASELPDVKSAPYWTRRLAKTGHFTVTE